LVVDVPPKLSARVRVLSSFAGNARKNDGLDALATALAASRNERLAAVDPEAASEVVRLLSERRLLTWWPSVPGRSRQPARASAEPRARRDSQNALGRSGRAHAARHTTARFLVSRPPSTSFGGSARHPDAGSKDREPKRAHRSRGRSFRHHPHRDLRHRSHTGREDHRDCRRRGALPYPRAHFASYCGTAPVEASSGEVVRHRLSPLGGNRKLKVTPCTWSPPARPGRKLGAEPTTARRSRRANLVRRLCGASKGASPMPS
jgi:transposase